MNGNIVSPDVDISYTLTPTTVHVNYIHLKKSNAPLHEHMQNIMSLCIEYLAEPPSIKVQGTLKIDTPDMQTVCLPIYDKNTIMLYDATKSSPCTHIVVS